MILALALFVVVTFRLDNEAAPLKLYDDRYEVAKAGHSASTTRRPR